METNWTNRRVMIVGLARSGIAAAQLLLRKGAKVTLSDSKPLADFQGALDDVAVRCELHLGERPDAYIAKQDMIVISPGVPVSAPFIGKAREMGVPVIGEMELGARETKGLLVSITGTNGKTTTTTLMGEIFKAAGRDTHVVGNIGYPITARCDETTEESVTVAEISSFQCETMDTFHPHVGAVLNITEDHLNRHGDMATYVAMKRRMLERQNAQDYAVFNAQDATCREMARGLEGHVIWFDRLVPVDEGAYVKDGVVTMRLSGVETPVLPAEEIRIPGPHNLENALAATAMAAAAGVDASIIAQVLRTFSGVEHRIETVRTLRGVTYINDSKGTNVDSTQKAIATMRAPTILILGGSDKHVDFAPLARSIVESGLIRHVVLIGQTAPQIEGALREAGYSDYEHAGYDFEKCIALCAQEARAGENVLLSPACASFDMFHDFEHRGAEFKRLVAALK